MATEQEIVDGLKERLETNLSAMEYSGPERLIGGELIDLLVEMLMGVLSGCFNSSGSLAGARVKKLGPYKRFKLKGRLISDVYDGRRKTYNTLEGEKVLDALVKTVETTPENETDVLLNYVETEEREWTPTVFRDL